MPDPTTDNPGPAPMSTRTEAIAEVYELITQGDTSHARDAAQALLAVEQAQLVRAERESTYGS